MWGGTCSISGGRTVVLSLLVECIRDKTGVLIYARNNDKEVLYSGLLEGRTNFYKLWDKTGKLVGYVGKLVGYDC